VLHPTPAQIERRIIRLSSLWPWQQASEKCRLIVSQVVILCLFELNAKRLLTYPKRHNRNQDSEGKYDP
jgi:hypothetical protein